jgi:serine/threonine protein kinase
LTIDRVETSLALAMHAERLGKYEIVRHLAKGGMANVFLARVGGEGGFERHVVLKMILDEQDDATLVPMFLDEARIIAALHHQHIAQVYEIGHTEGAYYLAMEYVHGETVRAVLESTVKLGQRLSLDFGLTVVCAAASGLHHAHERRDASGASLGIVHRDVTPSNVLVSYDGSIKVIDFGIAKAVRRKTRTATGFIKGKAGYMAPEQVKGYAVDRRSDVFALGVLAYELTTQKRAFQAETQFAQLEQIAKGRIAPPSALVPRYPVELEVVVMRALELDPDERYPDAASFRTDLERVARGLGLTLGPDVITDVLVDLYGPRPEPWLMEPGTIDYDLTPPVADMPVSIEVIEGAIDASDRSFARGSDEHPALRSPALPPAATPRGSNPNIAVRPPTAPPVVPRPPSHSGVMPVISIPVAPPPSSGMVTEAAPPRVQVVTPAKPLPVVVAPIPPLPRAAVGTVPPVQPELGVRSMMPPVAVVHTQPLELVDLADLAELGAVEPSLSLRPSRRATFAAGAAGAVAACCALAIAAAVLTRGGDEAASVATVVVDAPATTAAMAREAPSPPPPPAIWLPLDGLAAIARAAAEDAAPVSAKKAATAITTRAPKPATAVASTKNAATAITARAPKPAAAVASTNNAATATDTASTKKLAATATKPGASTTAQASPKKAAATDAVPKKVATAVKTRAAATDATSPKKAAAAAKAAPAKGTAITTGPAVAVAKPGKEAAPAKKSAAVTPGHVMLHVVTDPPDSTVVLDGVRMGRTPFHAEVPVRKEAWLTVRRFDRAPMSIRVLLDRDVTWEVKLPPKEKTRAARGPV